MTVRATGGGTATRRSGRPPGQREAPFRGGVDGLADGLADGLGDGLGDGLVDDLVDDLLEGADEELERLDHRPATACAAGERSSAAARTVGGAGAPGRTAAGSGGPSRVRPGGERTATPVGRPGDGLLAPGVPGVNEVRIVGRVSTAAEEHELPSGDLLVSLRVVVPRPASRTVGDRRRPRVPVDTIEVACWSAATRRRALRLDGGDLVEVTGSLRRRFYRAGTVSLSRYEVEARSLRRVREVTTDEEAVGE